MIKKVLLISFIIVSNSGLGQNNPNCEEDPLYHQLDFWLGEWIVEDTLGNYLGSNTISKILGGCAVLEEWEGGVKGMSLFYVHNPERKWRQVWVTENAKLPWGQKEKKMVPLNEEGSLVFLGNYLWTDGSVIHDRTRLTRSSEGNVRQEIEVSRDEGVNWMRTFVGIYKQK